MRHYVGDDIDPQWIRPLHGTLQEVLSILAFAFPAVAHVVIVAQQSDEATVLVKDSTEVRTVRAAGTVVFVRAARSPVTDTGYLRLRLEVVDDVKFQSLCG